MQDFQAFTIKFDGGSNVLFSEVGVSIPFNINDPTAIKYPVHNVNAIWDTGATCTVITKDFANKIGLISSGKTQVTGIGKNSALEDTFFVNIYLPNKVCIMNLKIAQVDQIAGGGAVLIGMDIIGSGDFSVYNENGKTVMSYRFPSIGGEDFVVEAGNIKNHRAITEKIEQQKKENTIKNKIKRKRKKEKMNKKRGKKKKKK